MALTEGDVLVDFCISSKDTEKRKCFSLGLDRFLNSNSTRERNHCESYEEMLTFLQGNTMKIVSESPAIKNISLVH